MHGGSLWYLFNAIKHYMQIVTVSYMGYTFSMWEVTIDVIMLFLLAWIINKFLKITDD